jgi:formamidopyrimidine-DNA glycosylase
MNTHPKRTMPELPEVETTRLGILPHIQNRTIAEVLIRQPKLRWPVTENLPELITGLRIGAVNRRGKYLLVALPSGNLILHLGMSGSLRILPCETEPLKHDHADFVLDNGMMLRFNDPRRFGAILWTSDAVDGHALLKDLGPEPLLSGFSGDYLFTQSRKRQTPAKSFIMDSHVVVGVGNIYANEALFMAGIRPMRLAGSISLARYRRLADAIKTVLENAIRQGGTTLRNFVNESGNPGYFKQQLFVYGRAGLPCKHCEQLLQEIRINNRSTIFCPNCQQ